MSKSSRKGDRREHQWADEIGGEKLSRKGYEGPDVKSAPVHLLTPLMNWEVKSKEALPNWLVGKPEKGQEEGWLTQMEREGADALVFRQNRGPWYMIVQVTGEDFEEIKPCGVSHLPQANITPI